MPHARKHQNVSMNEANGDFLPSIQKSYINIVFLYTWHYKRCEVSNKIIFVHNCCMFIKNEQNVKMNNLLLPIAFIKYFYKK